MTAKVRWGLATLACVGAAVVIIWVVVGNGQPAGQQPAQAQEVKQSNQAAPGREPARADEPVRLLVAFSRPLVRQISLTDPTVLPRVLGLSELRMPRILPGRCLRRPSEPSTTPWSG